MTQEIRVLSVSVLHEVSHLSLIHWWVSRPSAAVPGGKRPYARAFHARLSVCSCCTAGLATGLAERVHAYLPVLRGVLLAPVCRCDSGAAPSAGWWKCSALMWIMPEEPQVLLRHGKNLSHKYVLFSCEWISTGLRMVQWKINFQNRYCWWFIPVQNAISSCIYSNLLVV